MTEQRTLEDVGVKRTRQEEDTKPTSNSETATESQPQPKKAHTESGDTKQTKDSVQGKAKENQGSKSNATPQQKSATQDKAAPEPKKSQTDTKPTETESKKGDTEPEQPAASGEADAKAPLSTSVAKPEGDNTITTTTTTTITTCVLHHNTRNTHHVHTSFLPVLILMSLIGQVQEHVRAKTHFLDSTVCQGCLYISTDLFYLCRRTG